MEHTKGGGRRRRPPPFVWAAEGRPLFLQNPLLYLDLTLLSPPLLHVLAAVPSKPPFVPFFDLFGRPIGKRPKIIEIPFFDLLGMVPYFTECGCLPLYGARHKVRCVIQSGKERESRIASNFLLSTERDREGHSKSSEQPCRT